MKFNKSAIVVGAGIVGLAVSRALAVRGYSVTVLEKSRFATGASIRNFGMIWPIGQKDGQDYESAVLSRSIWKELCAEANIWHDEVGSLHLAYEKDECQVLQELEEIYRHRGYIFLNKEETLNRSNGISGNGLKGSLFSSEEMIVDPRKSIAAIASWLAEKYGVEFHFSKTVTSVQNSKIHCGPDMFQADEIYLCTGSDFDQFFGERFSTLPVTRCKLQMMRMVAQPGNWRMGPALCGALSLIHYKGFTVAPALSALKKRFEADYKDYIRWGIHVMVSQNENGELTVGDSHEYGYTTDPFDRGFINELILGYLSKFANFPNPVVTETWNGVYTKLRNDATHLVLEPEPGVNIINGFGGAGMTLGFGICEKIIASKTMAYSKY